MAMLAEREFNKDKEKNFSEWYNTIIYAADLVDNRYNVQGFIVHKPWSMYTFKKLYGLFERELEADGHKPTLFPTVIPEENFEIEKKHAEGFVPNVFWITKAGAETFKRALALRPTSETAFYQLYSLWVRDHSDLPIKLYQSCTVFRYESETNPFLRGREFLWIEAHDAFRSSEEAEGQVKKDMDISNKILRERLGLPILTFQRPAWDTFPGAEHTFATDVLMPDGKTLQIASTHLLGQKFAKSFNIQYKDETGKEHYVWQTCYGPGIWRIMAAIIGVHGDNKGLIFPPPVAPVNVVIVPIQKSKTENGNEKLMEKAKEIKKKLEETYTVEIDLSSKTPGYKYSYWELKGVPLRIEIGEKELANGTVTIARRDTKERVNVNENEILSKVKELNEMIIQNLKVTAESKQKSKIKDAETKEEVLDILDNVKGYARANFHSIETNGKECADTLQYESKGGKVRGILADKNENPFGKKVCVVCGKPAKHVVYIARQY